MKKRKRRGRRSLMAAVLCLSLVAAQAAPTVYAARTEAGQRQTLCEHHPAHDEDCGYTGGSQGQPAITGTRKTVIGWRNTAFMCIRMTAARRMTLLTIRPLRLAQSGGNRQNVPTGAARTAAV